MTSNSERTSNEKFAEVMGFLFGLIKEGKTDEQIIKDLVGKGIKAEDATILVNNAREMYKTYPAQSDTLRRYTAAQRGWTRMWTGFAWLAIGSCITWYSYSQAADNLYGGRYTVCIGAIALGAIWGLAGFLEWIQNR